MNELLQLAVTMCAIAGPTSSSATEIKNVQQSCQQPKIQCLVETVNNLSYSDKLKCLTK